MGITGDREFLTGEAGGKTLIDWAVFLSDSLLAASDSRGLLYRKKMNRHDWADNVFREGYVTYIEALFCKALECTGSMLLRLGDPRGRYYTQKAAAVREAIEEVLWLEDKGWYVNYRSADCIEDNLSIDTALLAWFHIANRNGPGGCWRTWSYTLKPKTTASPLGTGG
ncbi:MAG: hypothetical protein LBQ38_12505 [Spirochaetaceae bacterium]|nr:hypothetical protein [Spirochaetaceae bacterium]